MWFKRIHKIVEILITIINNSWFNFFYFLAAKDIRTDSGSDLVEVTQLDLASLKSVRKCAENLLEKEDKIDYLINNAGKFIVSKLDT